MYYRENSSSSGLAQSVLGFLFLAWIISTVAKISFWASAGIVLLAYVAFFLIIFVVQGLMHWVAKRKPCAHGVRSGKEGGCSVCALDEIKRKLESEARQAESERKKAIKERADALYASELASLKRKWLSRSELYLEMNPRQFENAIAQLFRELGYEVKQTPFSNDRGKDAILVKNGNKFLVECKRYDAENKIGRRDLQIFVAAMKEENATGGFYVNTGCFASTALEYAKQNNIELYDRKRFPVLVNSAYPVRAEVERARVMCLECGSIEELPLGESPSSGVCSNGHETTNSITTRLVCSGAFAPESFCEKCGADMKLVNRGYRKFWGCSRYPKCRFTRRYREPVQAQTLGEPRSKKANAPHG